MNAKTTPNRWTKGRAILAGGLVLGLGAAATLASWTDNEWVFGGSGNGIGPNTPGTAVVNMQQNTWTGAGGAEHWNDQPSANGGALTFTVRPDKLLPGRTVYSPMQLRAAAGSETLDVRLTDGVQAGGSETGIIPLSGTDNNSTALYQALRYNVYQGVDKDSCEKGNVSAGKAIIVPLDPDTPASATYPLSNKSELFVLAAGTDAATAGKAVDLCFALTLPDGAATSLQGKKTVPVWGFTGSAKV
ncbi:hypothetical protein FDW81_16800 [Pseudarthrobacter sp. NamB4]|nr:hypothetical protein FDW81_16800 [Pseudarthrobacter sp. NamB4]